MPAVLIGTRKKKAGVIAGLLTVAGVIAGLLTVIAGVGAPALLKEDAAQFSPNTEGKEKNARTCLVKKVRKLAVRVV